MWSTQSGCMPAVTGVDFCAGASRFEFLCPSGDQDGNGMGEANVVGAGSGLASPSDSPSPSSVPAFDEWYSSLDTVIQQAEAADPALARRVLEPFVVDGHLIDTGCQDKNANCSAWAASGECQANPMFLVYECPKSCNVCRHTSGSPREVKCQRDPAEAPIVQSPGGMTQLFERIISDPEIVARYTPNVVSTEPWIVVFENFATREHWKFLETELADQFEGSTVVGGMDAYGNIERQTLKTRTSNNAWCNLDSCSKSNEIRDLQDRLLGILGPTVGRHHLEALQVLKYTEGTFYHPHHDTITDQIHSWAGPRMLNAFIYFNDKPNGGGETEFTMLEPPLKVKPAVGRMVLWASQMDDDSLVVDHRATHQACNVTDGTKEAANLWVHLYDFQTPSTMGC